MTRNYPITSRRRARRALAAITAVFAIGTVPAQAEDTPEMPPIPLIVIPDIVGAEPVQRAFEDALDRRIAEIDGIRIAPARCDAAGAFVPGLGMTLHDEGGVTADLGDKGQYVIGQDGTGTANVGDTRITVEKDGSGTIDRAGVNGQAGVRITVEADGSGSYSGPLGQITLDGQGGGTWNSDRIGQIVVEPDGSGSWSGPQGQISNEGDGSGSWSGSRRIVNNGDGTGLVDGSEVRMDPLPPVPAAGRFPLLTAFRIPPAACGYVITLQDRILFDFDKSDLRADAALVVDTLSAALRKAAPERLEIRGHTDGKGSEDYNQSLSERRAATIEKALKERDVASTMQAQGFGESQPVAENDINGHDNPAGRQLNRRVEIFVPNPG